MIQPPTDNLYKFLSIFGLIVLGFGCYVPLQKLESLDTEVAKWRASWGPMLARAQILDETARDELDCAIAETSKGSAFVPSEHCLRVRASHDQGKMASRELRVAVDALKSDQYRLDFLQGQYVLWRNIGFAAAVFGFFCSAAGFWLWYVKVQGPLDLNQSQIDRGPRART